MAKLVFMWIDLNLLEIFVQIFLPGLKKNKNLNIFLLQNFIHILTQKCQNQVHQCLTYILHQHPSIFHYNPSINWVPKFSCFFVNWKCVYIFNILAKSGHLRRLSTFLEQNHLAWIENTVFLTYKWGKYRYTECWYAQCNCTVCHNAICNNEALHDDEFQCAERRYAAHHYA